MKIIKQGLLSAIAVVAVAFALSSTPATAQTIAHNGEDHNRETVTESTDSSRREQTKTDARAKVEATTTERREASEKLNAAKLKACENRKENIHSRMGRISERATKHLVVFNTISERAQAFYVKKGNVLTNYDELVANVAAKKAAAELIITTTTASTAEFTCDSANPKQTVETFRSNLKGTIVALKEYRTAVKDLIAGIKSVNTDRTTTSNAVKDVQ